MPEQALSNEYIIDTIQSVPSNQISVVTKNKYVECILMISSLFNLSIYDTVTTPSPSKLKRLQDVPKVSTYINRLKVIAAIFKHTPELQNNASRTIWKKAHDEKKLLLKELQKNNVLTDEMAKSMPNISDIMDAVARINPSTSLGSTLERLWLTICANVAPKRADWGNVRVVKSEQMVDPAENAIAVTPSKIVLILNRYKTHKTYSSFREELPGVVASEIRLSLKRYPRSHLLVSTQTKKSTSNANFASWAKRVFRKHLGQNATLTGLRHAWINEYANPGEVTILEREKTATSMLHSSNVQANIYFKTKPTLK